MLLLRRSRTLAAAAAPLAASLSHRASRAEPQREEATVVGAVVLFRHGARSPIFHLPDGPSASYETITKAPTGALSVRVNNGNGCHRSFPSGAPGCLTDLGWAQAEALGRRLRRRYGGAVQVSATHSTDTSRTVLTAHAVLTGLNPSAPASIDVIRGAPLAIDIGCAELAAHMEAGRAAHRATDAANRRTRAEIEANFGEAYVPGSCCLLAVHDDCVARHVHGHGPSPSVDLALCEQASRETAREVRAALRHSLDSTVGGGAVSNAFAARLAAGQLLELIASHISECRASPPSSDAPRLLLLSAHDTSLLAVLNALEHTSDPEELKAPDDGVWPPHTSCIAFELLSDGRVRVTYQWEEMVTQPVETFLRATKRVAATAAQHARICGESGSDGSAFHWAD